MKFFKAYFVPFVLFVLRKCITVKAPFITRVGRMIYGITFETMSYGTWKTRFVSKEILI